MGEQELSVWGVRSQQYLSIRRRLGDNPWSQMKCAVMGKGGGIPLRSPWCPSVLTAPIVTLVCMFSDCLRLKLIIMVNHLLSYSVFHLSFLFVTWLNIYFINIQKRKLVLSFTKLRDQIFLISEDGSLYCLAV
jgi:hypothetical protein